MNEIFLPFELNEIPDEQLFSEKCPPPVDQKRFNPIPPKMENSILRIVRERLTSLGLAQLPPSAVAFLAEKLASQAEAQALRSITPRSVARAILATTTTKKNGTPSTQNATTELSQKA